MVRGIEQGLVVRDDTDRQVFPDRMGKLASASGTGIYAFALMSNHTHILLKCGLNGLSTFMRRLLSGYAQYFNRRHKRVGHLFQNRYKSIICEEEAYFDKLVAYIHLNPISKQRECYSISKTTMHNLHDVIAAKAGMTRRGHCISLVSHCYMTEEIQVIV